MKIQLLLVVIKKSVYVILEKKGPRMETPPAETEDTASEILQFLTFTVGREQYGISNYVGTRNKKLGRYHGTSKLAGLHAGGH
jgi:hypothetical protein